MSLSEARRRGLVPKDEPRQPPKPGYGLSPQQALYLDIVEQYPDLDVRYDYVGAIPGRRLEVDIAIMGHRLAIEVDGKVDHTSWKGYARDREKAILLACNRWTYLPIVASWVWHHRPWVLERIGELLLRRDDHGPQNNRHVTH